jgi:hypothetical protein
MLLAMRFATKAVLGVLVVGGGALLARWQLARRFTDEPRHTVQRRLEHGGHEIELRLYEPMVVAETRVRGSLDDATNEGFRRLAGYIFGGNRGRESLGMTTPVATEPERLAMTTPVAVESADGEHVVRFVMPPGRALDALPTPDDARVTLREVPARRVAVLTYRGSTTPELLERHSRALAEALAREGLVPGGPAVSARYDPPWTLPVLRRSEVWIPLADPS